MTTQTKPTCQEHVPQSPGSYLSRPCGVTASFHEADPTRPGEGGKLWYCRRHAPSIIATKSAARNADWNARWTAERAEAEAKTRQQAENARKLAAFDDLLAACRAALHELIDISNSRTVGSPPVKDAIIEQLALALAAAGEGEEVGT